MISFIGVEYFTRNSNFIVIKFDEKGSMTLSPSCMLNNSGVYHLPKQFFNIAVEGETFNEKVKEPGMCIYIDAKTLDVSFVREDDLKNFSSL